MRFANGCGGRGHLKAVADTESASVVGSEAGKINSERQSQLAAAWYTIYQLQDIFADGQRQTQANQD